MALPLPHTRLVVLAGCDTASGALGAERDSVADAFLRAGASNVIATLWPINDASAATFFPVLHRYLVEGLSPAAALRATQLAWLHSPNADRSPVVWAAVQLLEN